MCSILTVKRVKPGERKEQLKIIKKNNKILAIAVFQPLQ